MEERQYRTPVWLYHKDVIKGELFTTDEELAKAEAEGWVDTPAKAMPLPGCEHVYTAYQAKLAAEKVTEKKDQPSPAKLTEDNTAAITPPGLHVCTLCGKTFSSVKALNTHGRFKHQKRK